MKPRTTHIRIHKTAKARLARIGRQLTKEKGRPVSIGAVVAFLVRLYERREIPIILERGKAKREEMISHNDAWGERKEKGR